MSKLTIGLVTGICGFLAYCIYFDSKRRRDPLFKQKLRERREASKKLEKKKLSATFPDPSDFEAVQKFFVKEVQLGEELLGYGDVENAVEHLSNAVSVCTQPHQLLTIFQQTLPTPIFEMLVSRIPVRSKEKTIIEEEVE